jgi:hypothetical protein
MDPLISLQTLLNRNGSSHLPRLVKRAQALQALDDRLGEYLTPLLKSHCTVAALRDDVLVINAHSPAWATRLRYLAPSILEFLHGRGESLPSFRAIRIRVSLPEEVILTAKPLPRPQLSIQTARHLKHIAQSIPDPDLQSILVRLSNR